MKLIIFRHGETEGNLNGVIFGQTETTLTDRGRSQARQLAARLGSEAVTGIISSDLIRARDTMGIVSEYHHAIAPVLDINLRERSWGNFEGRMVSEYNTALESYPGKFWDFEPPGGESLVALRARARLFLESLKDLERDGTYLISGHHSINKAVISEVLSYSLEDWRSFDQHNTCVNVLEITSDGCKSICVNCIKHLTV